MHPEQSLAELRAQLLTAGPKQDWRPRVAFPIAMSFYNTRVAPECAGSDHDMLLFQWGSYDWGEGERYEVDLTRQFILGDGEDDEIFQLSLTFRYPTSAVLRGLGAANRWCSSRAELESFRDFVLASPQLKAVEGHLPSVTLRYEGV